MHSISKFAALFGPGMLLAATGVGAGDLATAAFAGAHLGTSVLWAVLLGGALKLALNEGLARWQLASGMTFLEGVAQHLGRIWLWMFLPYLLLWSYFVGTALVSACGVAAQALWPTAIDEALAKPVWGALHAVLGLALVWFGGFTLFARVMRWCIAVMFVLVLLTAVQLWPGAEAVAQGFIPKLPRTPSALEWTLALIGGVGGTLTILCYGYWVRAAGRTGLDQLNNCRIDLTGGYLLTALFGMAMVVIGSRVPVAAGGGVNLIVELGRALDDALGPVARWMFLFGAWAALFSSLLGVWQAVPYLFADIWRVLRAKQGSVDEKSHSYRGYLLAISLVPLLGLSMSFAQAQKLYAITGALFMPLLALALLIMNGRRDWVGTAINRLPGYLALLSTLTFFLFLAWRRWTAG